MITREELFSKLKVGMKLRGMHNTFHATDEGLLSIEYIDSVSFVVGMRRENGSAIPYVFGAASRYNIDDNYIDFLHNDRTTGWTVVEKLKIVKDEPAAKKKIIKKKKKS